MNSTEKLTSLSSMPTNLISSGSGGMESMVTTDMAQMRRF